MTELVKNFAAKYDGLPISTLIFEPVENSGAQTDYKIIYANETFAADWKLYRPGEPSAVGKCVLESGVMSETVVRLMEENFRSGTAFSYYLPEGDIHVHFQPMKNLPAPYMGFFLTNVTEYEAKSSEIHFLRSIRQIENAAILMKRHEDGTMESVFASQEFARMMECDDQEAALKFMNGVGFIASTHPDDRLSVKRILRRRFSENRTKDLTIRKITAKKNILWCHVHYAFIDDFGKNYVYCTYFDVTAAKIYAERLRETYVSIGDNFYRENDSTLGMFRVNLSRNVIEDMRGKDLFATDSKIRSFSEIIKIRAANYPIQSEQARFLEIFNVDRMISAFLDGKTFFSEYFFSRRKDGRFCYVNFVAMLTRHPISNEIVAFISEQAANRAKVQSALLDKILARQFDMVAYIVNGKYGVVLGDSALIGRGSIFPVSRKGDYVQYLDNQVFPVLSGTGEQISEMKAALSLDAIEKNVAPDKPYIVNIACEIGGEIYYKRLDFYSISRDAEFFILLKSDTTEIQRQQMEQNNRLREALKEARQANVAKSAFLSRMSHEIRTPMNAIIGLDNIALHEKNLTAPLRKNLEQIGQSARYLLSLINDILDMSRIESGRVNVKSEEFSFESFLEQIKIIVGGQCADKGLNFRCDVIGALNKFYIGDDTKLKQILLNILGNAIKFTDAGGSVTLEVECTAQYEGQSNFRFTVRDTGIGMDKEYLPKIFDAFSQEDFTTRSSYGGTGLGLTITKNIVEMLNGKISVESERGVGSTFTVNLPLKNSTRIGSDEAVHLQNLNILIIDDDPVSLAHARAIFGESGIEPETVESGAKALEMIKLRHARREDYNLIFIDYNMPHLNGIEVTREVREILGGEVALIMITATDVFALQEEALAAGIDGFISKPLSSYNLLYEVQQILHRKKPVEVETPLAPLEGRRILIAEDMPVNAEILLMLLEMQEMEGEHAENGKIAVEMFEQSAPGYYDAVLMDIRMPVMDGLEATAAIRALERSDAKKIPIIAVTANAFDEDVQRSLRAGLNAHLSKPVDAEQLYRTLQELIGKNLASQEG